MSVAAARNGSAAGQREPAVRISQVVKRFDDRAVLDDLELRIEEDEFVALLGKSGSGKTTLLRLLSDLDRPTEGRIRVPADRSVVFQEPRLLPSQRVWRNVVLGRPRGEASRATAVQALEEVGLASHADAWPRTLSGGEAQRVALARALVREPGLLLLDEPFAALDALTRLRMQALVADLCARHQPAVLLVTHDVDEACRLADRVLVLTRGRINLELTVDKERIADGEDSYLAELREQLLVELGVDVRSRGPD